MSKVFLIAIVMSWANIDDVPHEDSITIEYLNGNLLYFNTQAECFDHIYKNIDELVIFAKTIFPTASSIKSFYCVTRKSTSARGFNGAI